MLSLNASLSGLSGNDLNWESVVFLENHVEELELAIFEGEVELDEDGSISDEFYESIMYSNPTMIYYKQEVNIQQMLKEGKLLDDCVDWYIIHDTNGNFVTLVGNVPDDYLTDEYIKERDWELYDIEVVS